MTEQKNAPRKLDAEEPYKWPYDYQHDDRTDLMKGLQCVAFLLEWVSEIGNEGLDGMTALGLSRILRKAANDAQMLYTQQEISEVAVKRNKNAATEGRIALRTEVPSRSSKSKKVAL